MRKASHDLQLDLPLAAAARHGQLDLPLDNPPVSYRLRRNDRAHIRVTVDEGVLSVSAPRHTRLPAIEAAVRERATALPQRVSLPDLPREWRDGATFSFLGESVSVSLSGCAETHLDGSTLRLALPAWATAAQIRDAVHGWLQVQARQIIGEQLQSRGVRADWSLSFSRSALNAQDADGRLRLNWRLVLLSRESIARLISQASMQAPAEGAQIDLLAE